MKTDGKTIDLLKRLHALLHYGNHDIISHVRLGGCHHTNASKDLKYWWLAFMLYRGPQEQSITWGFICSIVTSLDTGLVVCRTYVIKKVHQLSFYNESNRLWTYQKFWNLVIFPFRFWLFVIFFTVFTHNLWYFLNVINCLFF